MNTDLFTVLYLLYIGIEGVSIIHHIENTVEGTAVPKYRKMQCYALFKSNIEVYLWHCTDVGKGQYRVEWVSKKR
jgi:hypothetical protein